MLGQTLWDFQNAKLTLAECWTEVRVGSVFIDTIIKDLVDSDAMQPNDASMAKWRGSEKQFQIIDRCLRRFGGFGYISEYPITQMYVDPGVAKNSGGSNGTLKDLIVRSM